MNAVNSFFSKYKENVLQNKDTYIEAYNRMLKEVAESPAKYKGEPVDFLYNPMFLRKEDMEKFQQLTGNLIEILNKVINKYVEDQEFRGYFEFSPLLEKMILKNPGYDINVPMARFDIFYHHDGDFQFCELNADGSSGMVEAREIQRIFEDSQAMEDMKKDYNLTGFEFFDSWVDALLKDYQQFSKTNEKPRVAIIDFIDTKPSSEFIEFQKTFEDRGCSTTIADIRDLRYKEGKLFYQDFQIDCIYRRAVTWEIDENAEEVKDFIDAYLDGAVCVVGPIRSQIIHNKNIFSILHDAVKTSFLTDEERSFIQKHIPYTTKFDVNNDNMVEFAINNKDELVLKPSDKYACYGVYIGKDFSVEEWKDIIKDRIDQDYLLQQFCNVPKISMAMFDEENVIFEENNYIIGLYMYNQKFQGVYTRTGRENIIGSVAESFTIPSFVIDKKL